MMLHTARAGITSTVTWYTEFGNEGQRQKGGKRKVKGASRKAQFEHGL